MATGFQNIYETADEYRNPSTKITYYKHGRQVRFTPETRKIARLQRCECGMTRLCVYDICAECYQDGWDDYGESW